MIFKSYTDCRITSPISCDVYAAFNFNKTLLAVMHYAYHKRAYYVFGRRVKG